MAALTDAPGIIICGGNALYRQAVETSAAQAFPASRILAVDSLKEASEAEAGLPDQVLIIPEAWEEAPAASDAVDESGLPRWAIAIVPGPVDSRTPPQIPPAVLASLCRQALRERYLSRENQRLQGDLRMIARRIGHDFRMHLGGIVSAADLLSDLAADSSSDSHRLSNSLRHSADEMLTLLDRVKAVSMTSEPVTSDHMTLIGDVAAAVAMKLQPKLDEQGATLDQPQTWPQVSGADAWLRIIWSTLLTNAIRHGGEGVRIETGWNRTSTWRFWVSDNGPGIEPERRGELFPAWHSMHDIRASHGTGLAIVRRLSESMGGTCGYEPSPSGGALFWFTIPAAA